MVSVDKKIYHIYKYDFKNKNLQVLDYLILNWKTNVIPLVTNNILMTWFFRDKVEKPKFLLLSSNM